MKDSCNPTQSVDFTFSAKQFWVVNSVVFLVSTASFAYGYFLKDSRSMTFAAVFFCYLILSYFFKHRPPKSIIVNFSANQIIVNARFPDKSEIIAIDQIVSVSCLVKPHRFPMTELTFLLENGSKIIYFFEINTESNGFFGFPREMPDKKINKFAQMVSNHITLQRRK